MMLAEARWLRLIYEPFWRRQPSHRLSFIRQSQLLRKAKPQQQPRLLMSKTKQVAPTDLQAAIAGLERHKQRVESMLAKYTGMRARLDESMGKAKVLLDVTTLALTEARRIEAGDAPDAERKLALMRALKDVADATLDASLTPRALE